MNQEKSDKPKSPLQGDRGTKPSLPQGTRDFGPDIVRKRQYILNTIKNVFELYGFQPLETPAMENLETLMGKYGDEGDKLIFQIVDSGNRFDENFFEAFVQYLKHHESLYNLIQKQKKTDLVNPYENPLKSLNSEELSRLAKEILSNKDYQKYLPSLKKAISSKALKYDLTIPFARYVAMNHSQLTFPFKRYQIQPVWRADRPQRGRYREFYQCDADVVGSNSLINEIELTNIYSTVFDQLKIPVEIKLNSRKILTALSELTGGTDKMMDITIAIDKLDKIGIEKVKEELKERGLNDAQIKTVSDYLQVANAGNNELVIDELKKLFGLNQNGIAGLNELSYILEQTKDLSTKILIDPTLARGLNYYTGTIFEIKAVGVNMGSIGGGGRYDDLTGLFGVPDIPGVGISFGVDRIYDVLEELKLFPETIDQGAKVLFFNLGEEESKTAYSLLQQVRKGGTAAEIFHEPQKFDKQFKYAEKKNIPFVVIVGATEISEKTAVVKDLRNGMQQRIPFVSLPQFSFI